MSNQSLKIGPARVPENVPRGGRNWLSDVCQWWLARRGWQCEGDMHNGSKMVFSVAPHTSNWDFVLGVMVLFALQLRVSFFGKHSLFKPPLKWLLARLGGIPIERSQSHGMVSAIAEQIRQRSQIVLVITPEGTRSPVFPWKKGCLHIAREAGIPLQCIGFDYARKRLVFGPVLSGEDNIDNQMQTLYEFYATVAAKFPEKCLVTEPQA